MLFSSWQFSPYEKLLCQFFIESADFLSWHVKISNFSDMFGKRFLYLKSASFQFVVKAGVNL